MKDFFVRNWQMGLRMYSVRVQIVTLGLTILTLASTDLQPLLGLLWLIAILQASAILARFVAQPDLNWPPTQPAEEETL